jgi:hypothetical protein
MLLTRTITRKLLENIVHETFSQFGILSSSSLLDSLKLLGFYYATNAGISINIEDLKTPNEKENCLKNAKEEVSEVSYKWQQGLVSDTERFQSIIDSWNVATESLKNRVIEYYRNFDPTNNLYIMSFSGARGNMSQVRQLVGMRGLMSDQEGKIIDLPIQTNFREGLSSIDYIISSYGARKGIVDTALKTADSGYLTRRLIYIAQDLVIREENCKTKEGIIVELQKNSNVKNLVGRTLISAKLAKNMLSLPEKDLLLTNEILKDLKLKAPLFINIRSSLTCKSNGSICQKCYGWDLAQQKVISLGEAVGIIAAQSIGEPGTQLTMRTFHTGGIFTGENLKQILAPFSGKVIIPDQLKSVNYRTNHGILVSKLQEEAYLTIIDWKGLETKVFLEIGSFLYINNLNFVKKGQLLAEYSNQTIMPGKRRLKPMYTSISGEIRFENLSVRKKLKETRTIRINEDDGVLWIGAGKIFCLPKEIKYNFPKYLKKTKSLANLKLVTPINGIVKLNYPFLTIFNINESITLDLSDIIKPFKNCSIKIFCFLKNYQYIDKHTIIGSIELFPIYEGEIYNLRQKNSKYLKTLFFITESDVWKINSDQVNNINFSNDKKGIVRAGNNLNLTSIFSRSGFFLKKDGFKLIFQNAIPVFLSQGTILNYKQGDFVFENKIFATSVNYTQQTEDIVQGLPKIEELVEARRPKIKAYLSSRPGVFISNSFFNKIGYENISCSFKENIIRCFVDDLNTNLPSLNRKLLTNTDINTKDKKERIHIIHSLFLKGNLVVYKNTIFKLISLPTSFDQIPNLKKAKTDEVVFKNENQETLLFYGKLQDSKWKIRTLKKDEEEILIDYLKSLNIFSENFGKIESINEFENKKHDYIIKINKNNNENVWFLLQHITPVIDYELPKTSKILTESGSFIDIGEPITEGIIDVHELLYLLFKYHFLLDGLFFGILRSLNKFQILLVNSIQSIYQSQGVNISSKHIEIIVRQMTSKAIIRESGDTPLLPGELVRIGLINEIYLALKITKQYKTPKYEPLLLSATNSSLSKDGFLSAAGFQETKRVLTKSAIEGTCDWLRGLKECIIIGRLIPAGSTFLNYKSYLDNIYSFKK